MRTPVVTAALACLASVAAAAQDSQSPSVRTIEAIRLPAGASVRVDGLVDEAIWRAAPPATDFLQRDPDNGAPATERTEVRLVYDADRLILGVTCFDSEPGRLLGNQMQRDRDFDADDRFMWAIDTYLDGRSGYFFEINPSGAMGDGLIDPAQQGDDLGADINKSWDGIWIARVRRNDTGWTAEIEIPFRTLNFDPRAAAWGVNFQRTVRRKNEESLWTGHARNQGLARMSNAGHVLGIRDLSHGIGLDLKPYVVGNLAAAPGRGRDDMVSTGDVGLDLFYNVTPALRLNVSLNTDFAETEVDDRRVNLTRFPLFFEEKRDFFLEGSGFFDFGREPGDTVVPFFSRRIGLDASGRPQRIDVGTKLTGQAGPFDVGVLHVRTGETNGLAGEDFSVARVRRRILRQSYVGGLYTRRSARGAGTLFAPFGHDPRHTAGIDFELQTSAFRGDRNLELSGMYLWTSNPLETGDSSGYALRLSYPNDPLTARISVRELQPNYDPATGFVERRAYRRVNPVVNYTPRPRNHPWIRSFEFSENVDVVNDMEDRPLTREFRTTLLGMEFHSGDSIELGMTPSYERLEEDFEISDGVVLPAGSKYEFTRYRLATRMSERRVIAIDGEYQFGNFFSGSRTQMSAELDLRPRRGMLLAFQAEHNVVDLPEGAFEADVFSAEANTQFSPWVSLANVVQYDTESRLLGWQMRFRWIRRPGNDLYFVYTHNWREILDLTARRFATLDNRAATKLVYTLRF